jgi:formylglycine-generating enzyme required for sulfatase activity
VIRDRWTLLVVAVASVVGTGLGRGAGAVLETRGPRAVTAAVVAPPVVASSSPAAATGSASPAASGPSHDEGEPDDGAGDNPYDETPPAHPTAPRILVPARDGMLRLPGGRFTMGSSSPKAPANERPARATSVGPYWMDRTEVTVAAYRACVQAGTCPVPTRTSADCTYDSDDPDLPVSCVHWSDADAYCHFVGKRLPSEREWEFAARGQFAVPFPWGAGASCTDAITLINEQSGRSCAHHPARVGTHPGGASIFGVQDLSGNVEEWTADWYAELLGPGPAPRAGAAHVLRGGGWLSTPSQSRTTARNWGSAVEAGANVGFRCARDDDAASP